MVDPLLYREQRVRSFEDVGARFDSLRRTPPPVVILEDLDHVDRGTIELLEYVLELHTPEQRSESTPSMLFIATAEKIETPRLRQLSEASATTVIELEPLDEQGVSEYLSRRDVVLRVLEQTGGLPERIDELLGSLAPATQSAVAGLSDSACALFEAAVVLDRPATMTELATVSRRSPRLARRRGTPRRGTRDPNPSRRRAHSSRTEPATAGRELPSARRATSSRAPPIGHGPLRPRGTRGGGSPRSTGW